MLERIRARGSCAGDFMLQTIGITNQNATEKAILTARNLRRIGSWSGRWVGG